jgi:hypothetical protein
LETVYAYLLSVLALFATSIGVVIFLRRPLALVLVELCGGEHRADLWSRLLAAVVPLTSLFFSLLFSPTKDATELQVALRVARSGLLGLLVSLGVLMFFLLVFVGRYESREDSLRRLALRSTGEPPR